MIRKANINDVKDIQKLVNGYADENKMLPRSLNDIYENLRDFFVFEDNNEIKGVCALHIIWEDLAEIKALAVNDKYLGKGISRFLLTECISDAKAMGIRRLFCLTYIPDFFSKFSFKVVSRDTLPHKVWKECLNCPKFPDCDETAMIRDI